ncbi:unnamed protein product, partial [Ixodes persulcatus]
MTRMTKAGTRENFRALFSDTLHGLSRWWLQNERRPTRTSKGCSKKIKGLLMNPRQPWLMPSPPPSGARSPRTCSPVSPRPSPDHRPSRPPSRHLEDYASSPLRTPSPPSPGPRPPTPGRWAPRWNTSPPPPPTSPLRLPTNPASSPPTLRPPTPGAFSSLRKSPTTPTTHTTLGRRARADTRSTSVGERSPNCSSRNVKSSYGTAGASDSPPGTSCASWTGYASCTTLRSAGGEQPLRATPTFRPRFSSLLLGPPVPPRRPAAPSGTSPERGSSPSRTT